jgi:hypothetical protein
MARPATRQAYAKQALKCYTLTLPLTSGTAHRHVARNGCRNFRRAKFRTPCEIQPAANGRNNGLYHRSSLRSARDEITATRSRRRSRARGNSPPALAGRYTLAVRPLAAGTGGERCSQNSHICAVSAVRTKPNLRPGRLTIISALRASRPRAFSSAIGTGRRAERSNASGVSRTRTPAAPLRQVCGRQVCGRQGTHVG